MHLLKPYPDELVGSMINRACRHTGIQLKRILPLLTGRNITSHAMTVSSCPSLAEAYGVSAEEYLSQHTLLPYCVAFMQATERERLLYKFSQSPSENTSIASIAQSAGKSVKYMRLCPECIKDDICIYGEAYWKRSHHLPATYMCLKHNVRLKISTELIGSKRTIPFPDEVLQLSIKIDIGLSSDLLRSISEISVSSLNQPQEMIESWKFYQVQAAKLGYTFIQGHVYGELIATDMKSFFGDAFLESHDCAISTASRNPWPSLLVRESSLNVSTIKHVLLRAFLASEPKPSKNPIVFQRRKKPRQRDFSKMESDVLHFCKKEVAALTKAQSRVTVTELLRKADVFGVFKHNREKFPNLVAWFDEFKATPQSERQTGKRVRLYRK
jgi:TniQ